MGCPVTWTWCKAIDRGYFRGWPGLTSDSVRRFIKPSQACKQGHMDQRRAGICSTKSSHDSTPTPTNDHMEDQEQTPQNDKTHMVFMTLIEVAGQLFTDQTGRLPVTSNRGNNYIVIFYAVDPNYIKAYPIKSRHRSELLKAYEEVYSFLRVRGYWPQLHRQDNETSHNIETYTSHQYPAERAIGTWKNHFVAIHTDAAPTYRLSNWCKDLKQTDITLNMLRPCTTNPKLSAYKAMEGMYSFDATPMAPIGTECMIHIKPARRQTWGYHAIKAWYCAPALNHYRCIKAVTDTGAVRLTNTYKFLHHTLPTPSISDTNCIIKATQHLQRVINGQRSTDGDELTAIQHLQAIISGAMCPPFIHFKTYAGRCVKKLG
eukprot:CCRYP_021174-RA/>CCRYP_021174-RA protein AED:0.46 eAED:0.46 QI:0/0/0/1/1/1/2/0/373